MPPLGKRQLYGPEPSWSLSQAGSSMRMLRMCQFPASWTWVSHEFASSLGPCRRCPAEHASQQLLPESHLLCRLTGLVGSGRASPLPPISTPAPSPGSGEWPGQSKLLTPTGLMDQVRRGRVSAGTPTASESGTPASVPAGAKAPSAELTRCFTTRPSDEACDVIKWNVSTREKIEVQKGRARRKEQLDDMLELIEGFRACRQLLSHHCNIGSFDASCPQESIVKSVEESAP